MPGKKPDQSNIDPKSVSQSRGYNWDNFNQQMDKYKKVSRTKNPGYSSSGIFRYAIELPARVLHFIIDWFKVYEPRWRTALALTVLLAILSTVFFVNSSLSSAASFTFVQTDWTGGQSVSTAGHPGDQTNWNKFSAQTNADTTGTAGSVKVATYTNNVSETFTATTNRDNANTSTIWSSLATDNFNRANADPVGAPWITVTGESDMKLVSNSVTAESLLNDTGVYNSNITWPNDQYSQVKVSVTGTAGSSSGMGLWIRVSAAAKTGYRLVIDHAASNNVALDRFSAGTKTAIWQRTQAFTNGDTLRLEAQGTTLRAYLNGVQIGTDTTDANISSGNAGIAYSSTETAATADDWDGGGTQSVWTTSGQLSGAGNAQSLTLDNTANNIWKATLTKNDTPGAGSVTYYLANDGSTFNQVTAGSEYTFGAAASDLRFKIVLTGNATVQDVSISYTGYNSTADLTSSAYNTIDANNLVTKIAWTATGTSGSETVRFQIRTSTDGSSWSGWCGASDTGGSCGGSNFFTSSDNNVTIASNNPLRSNGNDQWFEYKITFASGGLATASVNDVTVTYVVNAPPSFDPDYPTVSAGGTSAAQDTNSASGTYGKVLINYRIKDTDSTSGTANPGFITPSFEYNIGGGWLSIGSGNLAGGDTSNKAVQEGSYTTYTATWNAIGQIPTNYLTTAQVRVTINDNEAANNSAQATTANFTLDTKVPVLSSFKMDSTTDKVTLVATDDTNLSYRFSNNSDLTADGVNGTSGQWQSAGGNSININPDWIFAGSPGTETVYAQVRDNAGNISSATAVAPSTPHDMDIVDISNANASSYKLFISWSVYTPVAGAAFSKYEIYRSTDGSSYGLNNTITDVSVNYLADFTTAQGTTYYYKVRTVDTDTDVGNFSTAVSDTPNGTQPGDDSPPIITNIVVESTGVTTATITWDTDELSDSRVDFEVAPSVNFVNGQTNASVVTSHSVTLTNLSPDTGYNYIVRSTDVFDNRATSDNGGEGYNFTTGSGPVISGVTESAVGEHSATIFWTTNVDSDSFVSYSTSPVLNGPIKVGSSALVGGSNPYQHSVDLSNLAAGTVYYYKVESKDVDANNSIEDNGGNYYSFTTTTDNVDPVISDISTPVIAPTAAVVVWQTDELATTQLDWGATSGALNTTTTLDSTLTIFHVVSITGLAEDTDYFFQVRSKDGGDNEATSDEESFTTGETTVIEQITVSGGGGGGGGTTVVLDKTAPKINNVKIDAITSFTAQVSFDTDEDTVGFVSYGKDDTNLNLSGGASEYDKSHTINLTGLRMGTDYTLEVKAIDKSGNETTSDPETFSTKFFTESTVALEDAAAFQQEVEDAIENALPSLVPPFIEKPLASEITDTTAKITWRTNVKTFSAVSYASDNDYDKTQDNPYQIEVSDTTNKVTSHELILQDLQPNTLYHFRAKSFSIPRSIGQSNDITFVTKGLNIQAQIREIGNSSFRATWRTTDATTSVVEYRNTRTGVLNQKTIEENTTNHDVFVDGLTPATSYDVSVYGYNTKGNKIQTASAIKITTSQDVAPPQILSLKIDTAIVPGRTDRTQTIISWKSNEPATSTVYYEEGAGISGADAQKPLANKVEITTSYVLDHAVVLTVLKPGGLYRIQVASTDTAGNTTMLPVKTIVVPTQSQSILDIVFKNFEDTFKFLQQIGK